MVLLTKRLCSLTPFVGTIILLLGASPKYEQQDNRPIA